MAQKHKHRAPKLKNAQRMYQECPSSTTSGAISLHKEDHVVEEQQSYAMVTGLLQVLVASIAYHRDLFPKTCFEMRFPSVISTEARRSHEQADTRSNETSNDYEMAHLATALAQQDQPLIVLAPGRTDGVDRLLAWLDEIFKRLLDRSLDAVQFSIYPDESRPSQVLELYTFSFQYRNGKAGERQLMGMAPPGRGSGTITTRSVRSRMVNVIDQLHDYQQQLPALPEKRYLMCHLFHSAYTPRLHRALGFRSDTNTDVAVPNNRLWYMKQRSLGSIDSGIHRVRLDIRFMARTDAAKDHEDRSALVQNMEYTRIVPRVFNPEFEKYSADRCDPVVGTRTIKRPREGFIKADKSQNLEDFSHDDAKNTSKSTRAMTRTMSSKPFSKDLEESYRKQNTTSADSLLPTQIMEAHDSPISPILAWNWKLRAGKAMEMSVKTDRPKWAAAQDDQVVRCECSGDREELPMLQCICCQKLQHHHCYGFALETHVYEHYCYRCLLEDTHAALLGDMKSLAIFRRALWILYEKRPSSPAEFAQKLDLNGKTTQGLIRRLDAGGYLASGRTRLSPVTTAEQITIKSQLYHNPLTSISGFYEPREDTPAGDTDAEDEKPRRKRIKT